MLSAIKSSHKSGEKAPASSGEGKACQAEAKSKAVREPVPVDKGEEDASDDGDVDEEGLQRLMKALGQDGLGDFERIQLHALSESGGGEGREGSASEIEDEEEEEEEEEEAEEKEGEEEEDELALDELDSVDEDAVPRQKIETNNEASIADCSFFCHVNLDSSTLP